MAAIITNTKSEPSPPLDEAEIWDTPSDKEYETSSSSEDITFKDELQIDIPTEQILFTEDDIIELSFLREEEIDKMVESGMIASDSRFDESLREKIVFSYPELILTLETGDRYPVFPPSYTLDNLTLPRLVVDNLRISLRNIMVAFDDANAIKRWTSRADNEENYGAFESDMVALQLATKTKEHILAHRAVVDSTIDLTNVAVNITAATSRSEILNSHKGIDPASYNTSAAIKELLGKSIPEVCETIPSNYRILHVENVVKPSLYKDFYEVKSKIRDRLLTIHTSTLRKSVPPEHQRKSASQGKLAERRERESLADYLTTPKCTFHGTQRHAITNIIRHGFLRPGDINPDTGHPLEVRCGNTYGRGIYTSPSPRFSLSYSGYEALPTTASQFSGLKLIVCATIMGRPARVTREDNWRNQTEPYPNSDSHVANGEYEYIVFHPRQTIPVLVIHLDWGKEHYDEFVNIPLNPMIWIEEMRQKRKENKKHYKLESETMFPADLVNRKQALMSRALKWFPYGYGPATGTRFVIEAVADDSDDEEEYGEYQEDRAEGKGGSSGYFWEMPAVDGEDERFDEFFMERRAKAGKVDMQVKVDDDDED
ncbi:hypothetical protein TWF694_004992 [Orbilia ellipsospora]|uniref:PARP catalytic domain-containing protein n=1 Tax=Orbilia ellipsospora TaxID=2528407 RepID=A0AAV9WUI8_9PEZI